MASSSTAAAELARVKFAPAPRKVDEESSDGLTDLDDDSEPESLDEEEVGGDGEYEVDAIKWAKWRGPDGNREHKWYYGVMWKRYLKIISETNEPIENFNETEDGSSLVVAFWKEFDLSKYPYLAIPPGKEEPPKPPISKQKSYFETPKRLLKEWFKDFKPKRDLEVYKIRRKKELAGAPVTKADSDYYIKQKRIKAKRLEKRKQAMRETEAVRQARTKPSTAVPGSASAPSVLPSSFGAKVVASTSAPLETSVRKIPTSVPSVAPAPAPPPEPVKLPSHAHSRFSSLDSIFDSEHEANDATLPSNDVDTNGKGIKRKHPLISTSPVPSAGRPAREGTPQDSAATKKIKLNVPEMSTSGQGLSSPQPTASSSSSAGVGRLAGFGKIAKRAEPLSLYATFGQPEPGILDTPVTTSVPMLLTPDVVDNRAEPVGQREPTTIPAAETPAPVLDLNVPTLPHVNPPTPISAAVPPMSNPEHPTPLFDTTVDGPEVRSPATSVIDIAESQSIVLPARPDQSVAPDTSRPLTSDPQQFPPMSANPVSPQLGLPNAGSSCGPSSTTTAPRMPHALPQNPTSAMEESLRAGTSPESKPKVAPTKRGLYVQPKKIALLDPQPDSQMRPSNIRPRSGTFRQSGDDENNFATAKPRPTAYTATTPLPKPKPLIYVPRSQPPAGPSSTPPIQPRGWTAQAPPSGPSSMQQRGAVTGGQVAAWQSVPLPPQTTAFLGTGRSPVWQQQVGGNTTPLGSPNYSPPLPQNGFSVPSNTHIPPVLYDVRKDPRLVGRPPSGSSGDLSDPKRSAALPAHPERRSSPASPSSETSSQVTRTQAQSGGSHDRLFDARLTVTLRPEAEPVTLTITLLRGATAASIQTTEHTLDSILSKHSPNDSVYGGMAPSCLEGAIERGARMIQWTKVAFNNASGLTSRGDWEALKARVRQLKMFVSYTNFAPEGRVNRHYALVLASPQSLDPNSIGLGVWRVEDISLAMVLISLPLTSDPPPSLPNPARPDFDDEAYAKPDMELDERVALLDSVGLTRGFLLGLKGRTVSIYPAQEGTTDVLKATIKSAFQAVGAYPPTEDAAPDVIILFNAKLVKALRSQSLRSYLPRRTRIYVAGPSMSLYPSQWHLRAIWQTGALVTFSPTFILRSPERFGEIMKIIRASRSWAAYILPSVIEWASLSWAEPARCPDPTKAFEALCRSLFLDQHLLQFSGSAASSGGSLAVSCAPPLIHLTKACAAWTEWLQRVFDQRDFQSLVDVCAGVQPDAFQRSSHVGRRDSKPNTTATLELVDIETSQIMDLTAMRMRPELLPYRRYMYIGDISLDQRTTDRLGTAIEFVAADRFEAIYSGVGGDRELRYSADLPQAV